ncbi:MAG: hypothetical protein IT443_06535 [Phycisphaeraceae bacterium]|nr:hypothetical protein [Phycisphaeraceae bacterium]
MALMLLGLAVWGRQPNFVGMDPYRNMLALKGLSAVAVVGSQFVFLVMVADDLCPKVPSAFAGACKLLCGGATWALLAWVGWQIWLACP